MAFRKRQTSNLANLTPLSLRPVTRTEAYSETGSICDLLQQFEFSCHSQEDTRFKGSLMSVAVDFDPVFA